MKRMKKKKRKSYLLFLCLLLERYSSSSVASLLENQDVHCIALRISSIFTAAAVTMLFFFVQFIVITCVEQSDSSVNVHIRSPVSINHRVTTHTHAHTHERARTHARAHAHTYCAVHILCL